jgi:hypothetical protein
MESNIMEDPQPMINEARDQIYKKFEIIKEYAPHGLSVASRQALETLREALSKHEDNLMKSSWTREGMTSWKTTLETVILRFTTEVGGGGQGEFSLRADNDMIEAVNKEIKSCLVYAQAILLYREKQERARLIDNYCKQIEGFFNEILSYNTLGVSYEALDKLREAVKNRLKDLQESSKTVPDMYIWKKNLQEALTQFPPVQYDARSMCPYGGGRPELVETPENVMLDAVHTLIKKCLEAAESIKGLRQKEDLARIKSRHEAEMERQKYYYKAKTTLFDMVHGGDALCVSNLPNQYFVQTTRRRHT